MQRVRTSQDIGRLVRQTRKAQSLRQPDLACACGTSIRFIVELEHGKPTAQLAKVLHVLRMLGFHLLLDDGETRGPQREPGS
jgi:y4mF family transcriptional regulator